MPHPQNAVRVTATAETAAEPRESKNRAGILGHMSTAEKPADIEFNYSYSLSSLATVAAYFGDGSAIHEEAKAVRSAGCTSYEIVVAERTETTETLAGTDTSITNSGQGSAPPATGFGDTPASLTVDGGTPIEPTPVTSSPPRTEDGTAPAPGTAVMNYDTIEVVTGDETSGAGTGIQVTYETLSWTLALQALAGASVDTLCLAGERYDRSTVGDYDELSTWGDGQDVFIQYPYIRGTTLGGGVGPQSIAAEQDLVQDVGAYSPSKLANPIANSSTDSLGGFWTGYFATRDFWTNPIYQVVDLNVGDVARYTAGNVGAPEMPGTFEGGRDGTGMTNVLLNDGGTQLSNTLSTAGANSPYRYNDIARAEALVKVRAKNAVTNAIRRYQPRFEDDGEARLEGALKIAMDELVAEDGSPFEDIIPDVPDALDLSQDTRLNRIWDQIQVTILFAPTVHRAAIEVVTKLWDGQTAVESGIGTETVGATV